MQEKRTCKKEYRMATKSVANNNMHFKGVKSKKSHRRKKKCKHKNVHTNKYERSKRI